MNEGIDGQVGRRISDNDVAQGGVRDYHVLVVWIAVKCKGRAGSDLAL